MQSRAYISEGIELRSPEITSCENGEIKWTSVPGVSAYRLTVDGRTVSDNDDGFYHSNTFDASALTGRSLITLEAAGGNARNKCGGITSVLYDGSDKTLSLSPVKGLRADGEVLRWDADNAAAAYLVIDIDYNVIKTADTFYDMSNENIVLGVYHDTCSPIFGCVPAPCDIPYLNGSGTAADPYIISTPFDLRTVDYYESLYASAGGTEDRKHYKIICDLDYNQVRALESDSNIYTLRKPFFGALDGCGKTLSDINVNYDGGYWALFDFIAKGGTVKNIRFVNPSVDNKLQKPEHPLDASVATVANRNYGTVDGITVVGAKYASSGGEICGIVSHNFGVVENCTVSGEFTLYATGMQSQACYEAAGITTENLCGGHLRGCYVPSLTVKGEYCKGSGNVYYCNMRTAAGIVSVNRAGGTVENCGFSSIAMINALCNCDGNAGGFEWGGIVAYNAGTVIKGTAALGKFVWNGAEVTADIGADGNAEAEQLGRLVGKNDGVVC